MRESLYKSYSLRGTALALLLSTKDVKCPILFDFISEKDTTEDFLYAVDQMTRDGIAVRAGDKLEIQEPYSKMAECIASSKITVRIRAPYLEGGDSFVYQSKDSADELILMTKSQRKKGSVLLTYLNKEEMFSKYFSDGDLPEETGASLAPEKIELSEVYAVLEMLSSSKKITDVHFLFGAECLQGEGNCKMRVAVFQSATGVYCAAEDSCGPEVFVYDKLTFKEKLWELFEGAEELTW